MPASFDYTPGSVATTADATPTGVFLYNSTTGNYSLLPNVVCDQIQYKEGPAPPAARFRYLLDQGEAAANGWPIQFEQLWPLVRPPSAYAVGDGDELAVLGSFPDGSTPVLFHGLARLPQTDLEADRQEVSFTAVGVGIRCFNAPIGGRPQRDADDPQSGAVVNTSLPFRMNPADDGPRSIGGFLPNCTPAGWDVGQGGNTPYPVFLDPRIDRDPDPRTFWNLSKAARAILAQYNAGSPVANPDFGALDALLQNRRPLDGAQFYDPTNPSTYQEDDNLIRDYDATNKPWPLALGELLGFYGFGTRFACETNPDGTPYDHLMIYRKDAAGPTDPKPVFLPAAGSSLATSQANLAAFHGVFDFQSVANQFQVEAHPDRCEISVVLAPGFAPNAADASAANRVKFRRSFIEIADQYLPGQGPSLRDAYRLYLADECGDGHWSFQNAAWETAPIDLSPIFPDDANGDTTYVNRYRPGENTLISSDLNNRRRRAELALSRDYAGPDPPCAWDGTGTWQAIQGDWRLLDDRLGIAVTADDPELWNVGRPAPGAYVSTAQEPTGVLHGITAIAAPGSTPPESRFFLRLTTVVEADYDLSATALKRAASPTRSVIARRIDARDHFRRETVKAKSAFNPGSTDVVVEDDSDAALTHASQLRSAHELPPLSAAVVIPAIVLYFQVGDRVDQVSGRGASLQVNAAGEQLEAPGYPYVVGSTWDFQGGRQSTTLQLADRRLEPPRL